MNNAFGVYSRYYNLLYRDKDYNEEASYIDSLICKYGPGAKTILDLGCGTGRHASLLAGKGYLVHGVDISEGMLAEAREASDGERLNFSLGDIRSVRLGKCFDVATSLFHVMSYQIRNEDLQDAFNTAHDHLKTGGVFIFDCWYGPAVLTNRPAVRIKRLEDEFVEVTRLAEPVMYANMNIVDVNYHIFVKNKASGVVDEIKETHRMRYLFKTEIDQLLKMVGFTAVGFFEFLTDDEPGYDTWSVCFVGLKR